MQRPTPNSELIRCLFILTLENWVPSSNTAVNRNLQGDQSIVQHDCEPCTWAEG
jgi:hypothetical protein